MKESQELFHEPGCVAYCGHVGAPCKDVIVRLLCGAARARMFFWDVEATIIIADRCMVEDCSAHTCAKFGVIPHKSKPGPAIGVGWADVGPLRLLEREEVVTVIVPALERGDPGVEGLVCDALMHAIERCGRSPPRRDRWEAACAAMCGVGSY